MKIIIPTIGTRGDVQPFIALAQGLDRAGHTVTLVSHPVMRILVESHNVTFAPMGPDIDLGQEAAAIRARSPNVVMGLIRVMRFAFNMLEQSHEDILAQCREADLVVTPSNCAAGKNEADLLGLPSVSANFMPWSIPVHDPDRPLYKRLAFAGIGKLIELITTRPLNRIRRHQGLPPVGPEGFTSTRLDLVPVSPAIYAPNPHWEPRHRMVGYWFVKEPDGWGPPEDLLAFLDNGEPPLLISLGAMSLGNGDAVETVSLFVDAIQQAGVRAIIQGWREGLGQLRLPPIIFAAGTLPHSWLMPRTAGVVHHGGFGATSATLRAGVPQLIIPHIADQFYWAQRVHTLGVGVPSIPRSRLSIERLTASLEALVHDDMLRTTASHLAEQIRTETGVDNAVRLIEETFD
jgi:UDP:flavonoid glycosyltransferase YjiC (YdhE family)